MAQLSENFGAAGGRTGAAGMVQQGLPILTTIYVLSLVMPTAFNIGDFTMGLYRMMILLMFVPAFINTYTGRLDRVYPMDWLLLAYSLWYFIAFFVNHGTSLVQFVGFNVVDSLGAYLLGRATVRNARQFRAMVKYLMIAVLITVPFAFYELFTSHLLLNEIIRGMPGLRVHPDVTEEMRLGLFRAQGLLEHPILYGIFCGAGVSMALVLFRAHIRALLMGFCVFTSLSSGPFLVVIVQAGLLMWHLIMRGIKNHWRLLLIIVLVMWTSLSILSDRGPIKLFINYATLNPATGYWRLLIWEYGSQNVADNPWFGIGFRDWNRPSWMGVSSVDNYWLVIAMRIGYPGIFPLLAAFFIALWKVGMSRTPNDPDIDACRWAWILAIASLMFALCTVHIWSATASLVFFLLGAGIWIIEAAKTANASDPDAVEIRGPEPRGHARWQSALPDRDAAPARASETARPVREARTRPDRPGPEARPPRPAR